MQGRDADHGYRSYGAGLQKSVKKLKAGRRAKPDAPAFRRAPIGSLRVFAAVAQHMSVSRAADALGVTASAVSMQLKTLEDYLQLPLLRRRGRNLELTPEGERLLPRVERGLRELEEAIDAARGDRCEGEISVTTLASFMQQWLMPRLPDFQSRHPKLQVTVHTSAEPVDLRQSRLQAAVRMGRGQWPGLHAEKLLDEWLVVVCAPALLARHGSVRTAEDLRPYRLVHSTSEPWSAWLLDHGDQRDLVRTALYDDSVTVIRAAEAGQGLAGRALEPGGIGTQARATGARERARHPVRVRLLVRLPAGVLEGREGAAPQGVARRAGAGVCAAPGRAGTLIKV
jgi:LysR family glycine cleavage system transcriptional activator